MTAANEFISDNLTMTGPSSSPLLRILRAPFTRRAWAELAYSIVSALLDVGALVFIVPMLFNGALWAASAPLLLRDNATLLEQIKAKDAEIAQLKGLSPGADGQSGGGGLPTGGEGDIPLTTEYGRAIGMAVRKAGINMPSS